MRVRFDTRLCGRWPLKSAQIAALRKTAKRV
jgi:hypothetical protein